MKNLKNVVNYKCRLLSVIFGCWGGKGRRVYTEVVRMECRGRGGTIIGLGEGGRDSPWNFTVLCNDVRQWNYKRWLWKKKTIKN